MLIIHLDKVWTKASSSLFDDARYHLKVTMIDQSCEKQSQSWRATYSEIFCKRAHLRSSLKLGKSLETLETLSFQGGGIGVECISEFIVF